jgi:shikimate kinase
MKIFLIGLPGCGKTTLGKQVAAKLNVPFLDLDTEIEKAEGKSVKEIFAQYGENSFREKESACLRSLTSSDKNFVLATGGGAPCFFDNMDLMNKSGITVFLNVPLDEIARRLQKTDLKKRPLFAGIDRAEIIRKLEELGRKRFPFYIQARKKLSSANLTSEEILMTIKE